MSAYIIADITLFEPEKMARYSDLAHKAMTEHGAELLVMGEMIDRLEGNWAPQRIVVLRFANRQAAKDFYGGDVYIAAKHYRAGIASFNAVVVEGVALGAGAALLGAISNPTGRSPSEKAGDRNESPALPGANWAISLGPADPC